MVEYASTFFMSVCAMAMVAANSAVPTPTQAMSEGTQSAASAMIGLTRVRR